MTSTLAHGLSPARVVLDNGLVVLAQENPTTPAVAVNASFDAGSVCDPSDCSGVSYLTGKVLDAGTDSRPGDAIAEMLDWRGVSLRISVFRQTFSVSCVCLAGDFLAVLELIADVLRHPRFQDEEIGKRRIKAISSVRQDDDNTAVRAGDTVIEMLYAERHPYGRPVKGTVESLERIHRPALARFHQEHLVPNALRLAIVGYVPSEAAIEAAARLFGDWPSGAPSDTVLSPPPLPSRRIRQIDMPGKSQTDIAYGFTTVRRLDPRFYAYWMMNTVLGQFGLGGRLAENIRERQGMAYYAYSTLDAASLEAPLIIRAGVDPANVQRTVAAIDAEVRALGSTGPTASEFNDTRESLIGSIPRMLETNESIAEFLQAVEQFGLGLDYDRQLPSLIRQVTQEDVQEAAREVLNPDRAAIAIAGPPAQPSERRGGE